MLHIAFEAKEIHVALSDPELCAWVRTSTVRHTDADGLMTFDQEEKLMNYDSFANYYSERNMNYWICHLNDRSNIKTYKKKPIAVLSPIEPVDGSGLSGRFTPPEESQFDPVDGSSMDDSELVWVNIGGKGATDSQPQTQAPERSTSEGEGRGVKRSLRHIPSAD